MSVSVVRLTSICWGAFDAGMTVQKKPGFRCCRSKNSHDMTEFNGSRHHTGEVWLADDEYQAVLS